MHVHVAVCVGHPILARAHAKLQAKRKQAENALKGAEERRAEEESIAYSKDIGDEINKEGKAKSKSKSKSSSKSRQRT